MIVDVVSRVDVAGYRMEYRWVGTTFYGYTVFAVCICPYALKVEVYLQLQYL